MGGGGAGSTAHTDPSHSASPTGFEGGQHAPHGPGSPTGLRGEGSTCRKGLTAPMDPLGHPQTGPHPPWPGGAQPHRPCGVSGFTAPPAPRPRPHSPQTPRSARPGPAPPPGSPAETGPASPARPETGSGPTATGGVPVTPWLWSLALLGTSAPAPAPPWAPGPCPGPCPTQRQQPPSPRPKPPPPPVLSASSPSLALSLPHLRTQVAAAAWKHQKGPDSPAEAPRPCTSGTITGSGSGTRELQ